MPFGKEFRNMTLKICHQVLFNSVIQQMIWKTAMSLRWNSESRWIMFGCKRLQEWRKTYHTSRCFTQWELAQTHDSQNLLSSVNLQFCSPIQLMIWKARRLRQVLWSISKSNSNNWVAFGSSVWFKICELTLIITQPNSLKSDDLSNHHTTFYSTMGFKFLMAFLTSIAWLSRFCSFCTNSTVDLKSKAFETSFVINC